MDTDAPTGKLLTVLSAICQFERDITVQRTCEGIAAARARGRKGVPPKANKKDVEMALSLYDSKDHYICEICRRCGISQGTLYCAIHEHAKHT